MNRNQDLRRKYAYDARRLGYTLLEIMTSVTLALLLMYSVAKIYSRVGGEMNETMSTMEMTNALRNARNRLTADLECLSVSPEPPRNSRMNEGYLCYVEGMGGPFSRVFASGDVGGGGGSPFSTSDVALDTERFEAYGNNADYNSDNTIGDLDDILSFTAKAPDGQPFRGRYVRPVYDGSGAIVDGELSVFESQYAEIIWFVRGTTLYRRVLPLLSNQQLQESFVALAAASASGSSPELASVSVDNIKKGFGFYSFYDVSVHLGYNELKKPDGTPALNPSSNKPAWEACLVANTLGDLTNRENRYFYWNSVGLHLHPDYDGLELYPLPLHGNYAAWYWLRMATLQESAAPNFRAGAPFGQNSLARDFRAAINGNYVGVYTARRVMGGAGDGLITDSWKGTDQTLAFSPDGSSTLTKSYASEQLPIIGSPFIDYWNNPNVWNAEVVGVNADGSPITEAGGINSETGDLQKSVDDSSGKVFNQDVVLTNVISFNVKIWDKNVNAYVDLGYRADSSNNKPDDFGTYGRYGNPAGSANPWDPRLPCVYDTWSEQYQRDLCLYDNIQGTNYSSAPIGDIPADGKIESSQLKDYPPPYDQRADSLQIELRVFDPRSKHIRNATFNVDLSRI